MFSISAVTMFTSVVAEQKFQTTHITVFRRLYDNSHWTQKTHLPFTYEGECTIMRLCSAKSKYCNTLVTAPIFIDTKRSRSCGTVIAGCWGGSVRSHEKLSGWSRRRCDACKHDHITDTQSNSVLAARRRAHLVSAYAASVLPPARP